MFLFRNRDSGSIFVVVSYDTPLSVLFVISILKTPDLPPILLTPYSVPSGDSGRCHRTWSVFSEYQLIHGIVDIPPVRPILPLTSVARTAPRSTFR